METQSGNITVEDIMNIFNHVDRDIARQIISFIPEEHQEQIFNYLTQNNDIPPPEFIVTYSKMPGKKGKNKEKCSLCYKIKLFLKGFYEAENNDTKNIINILESNNCNRIIIEYVECKEPLTIKNASSILVRMIYYLKKNKLYSLKQSKGLINGIQNIISNHKKNKNTGCNIWFKRLLFFMGMYSGLCLHLLSILNTIKKIQNFFNYLTKKCYKSFIEITHEEKQVYEQVINSMCGKKMKQIVGGHKRKKSQIKKKNNKKTKKNKDSKFF